MKDKFEPSQEQLDAFILRAKFTYGWENLESAARRMVEHACYELNKLAAPATPPLGQPDKLEQIIDGYLSDYVQEGKTEDGADAFHTPCEWEVAMIKDAIMGLLVDPDWDAEWGKHMRSLAAPAQEPAGNFRRFPDGLYEQMDESYGEDDAVLLYTHLASIPEGWQLVPVEPTPKMLFAGMVADRAWQASDSNDNGLGVIYKAMLQAAKE